MGKCFFSNNHRWGTFPHPCLGIVVVVIVGRCVAVVGRFFGRGLAAGSREAVDRIFGLLRGRRKLSTESWACRGVAGSCRPSRGLVAGSQEAVDRVVGLPQGRRRLSTESTACRGVAWSCRPSRQHALFGRQLKISEL